ncbi:MAG: hypothetical protein ACLU8F_02670 [Clostridia bacterium]
MEIKHQIMINDRKWVQINTELEKALKNEFLLSDLSSKAIIYIDRAEINGLRVVLEDSNLKRKYCLTMYRRIQKEAVNRNLVDKTLFQNEIFYILVETHPKFVNKIRNVLKEIEFPTPNERLIEELEKGLKIKLLAKECHKIEQLCTETIFIGTIEIKNKNEKAVKMHPREPIFCFWI